MERPLKRQTHCHSQSKESNPINSEATYSMPLLEVNAPLPSSQSNPQSSLGREKHTSKPTSTNNATTQLEIDISHVTESDQYDDLLDELLSDNADDTPKSTLEQFPSPTFQNFWESGDDDDDNTSHGRNQDDLEHTSSKDESMANSLREDIMNLSKLIDDLEMHSGWDDKEGNDENVCNTNHNPHPNNQKLLGLEGKKKAETLSQEPVECDSIMINQQTCEFVEPCTSRRTSTGCISTTRYPMPDSLGIILEERDMHPQQSSSSFHKGLQWNVPDQEYDYNVNQVFVSVTHSSGSVSQNREKVSNKNQGKAESIIDEAEKRTVNMPMSMDPNSNKVPNSLFADIEIKQSMSTCTADSMDNDANQIKSGLSLTESNGTETDGVLIDAKESGHTSTENTTVKSSSLESLTTKSSRQPYDEPKKFCFSASTEIQFQSATSAASDDSSARSKTAEEQSLAMKNDKEVNDTKANKDPYEWAYNVWKRLGLMSGTPTNHSRPVTMHRSTVETPSKKLQRNTVTTVPTGTSSYIKRKNNHVVKLRNPKDRLSLPSKMVSTKSFSSVQQQQQQQQHSSAKPKPSRNGAGFSILLSKWKDKSEGNPNLLLLSPRAMSPQMLSPRKAANNNENLVVDDDNKLVNYESAISSPKMLSPRRTSNRNENPEPSISSSKVHSPRRKLCTKMEVQMEDDNKAGASQNQATPAPDIPPFGKSRTEREKPETSLNRDLDGEVTAVTVDQAVLAESDPCNSQLKFDAGKIVAEIPQICAEANAPSAISSEEKKKEEAPTLLETEKAHKMALLPLIDTTPVLSPSRRRELEEHKRKQLAALAVARGLDPASSDQPSKQQPEQRTWPTPAKNKNALSRYLQRTKPTPIRKHKNEGHMQNRIITEAIDENEKSINHTPCDRSGITPANRHQRYDDRSTTSTLPLLSPADDTLLEPRDVMRQARLSSDRSQLSKTSSRGIHRTPMSLASAPCKEIFVFRGDDDMKSVATESFAGSYADNSRVVDDLQEFLHLNRKQDSMSFDSQSEVTQVTFRTETMQNLEVIKEKANGGATAVAADGKEVPSLEKTAPVTNSKAKLINVESPAKEDIISEPISKKVATPDFSERPWRNDLLRRNVATAMEKATERKLSCGMTCDCENSLAMFSSNDEMVEFFLPLMVVSCSCRKTKKLINPDEPCSLVNILRPWQISFLGAFGIVQGDHLVKAHHRSARSLSKSLYNWRQKNSMTTFRLGSCGMALQIWSNTCKAYVRSIRKQIAAGANPIERPNTLSVLSTFLEKMPQQVHQNLPQAPRKKNDKNNEEQKPDSLEEI